MQLFEVISQYPGTVACLVSLLLGVLGFLVLFANRFGDKPMIRLDKNDQETIFSFSAVFLIAGIIILGLMAITSQTENRERKQEQELRERLRK